MQKTFGGERLGSGNKLKVELSGYGRSNQNLSEIFRSTMSAGTLVPFLVKVGLPGDTWDMRFRMEVLTHPTIGPLFGSFKGQIDVFAAAMRLYNSLTHNNYPEIGLDMAKVKFPQIELKALPTPETVEDLDNCQVNPSCLLKYLGISGIGINTDDEPQPRQFNATALLMYWEVVYNYFSNKQEEVMAVIRNIPTTTTAPITGVEIESNGSSSAVEQAPSGGPGVPIGLSSIISIPFAGAEPDPKQIMLRLLNNGRKSVYELTSGTIMNGGGTLQGVYNAITFGNDVVIEWSYLTGDQPVTVAPNIQTFPLVNVAQMRQALLNNPSQTVPYVIDENEIVPYGWLCEINDGMPTILHSQEGLAVKTYQSDIFNNWLRTEYYTYISNVTAVSTAGDSFSIDSFNVAQKVWELMNKIAVSGGSYEDWTEVTWGVKALRKSETPWYAGGMSKELIFQEVVSMAPAEGQPTGTLSGKGRMTGEQRGGNVRIKLDEPSMIMGIVSLTPRIDYSQGNDWHVHLKTLNDLHKPSLDQIGFEDVVTEQMAWWDTKWAGVPDTWNLKSAGKRPAWMNYRTSINRTYGNFAIANSEMFMTLNRRYEGNPTDGIIDLTTYIDPVKFNFIFADASLDAQNFWVQIASQIQVRRVMSAREMPNL